jgi:hypothetical protein
MSILSTSPTSTRHFDMNIAAALGNINAAIIVQQLHYWMQKKEVGVIVEGVKYIYNTFVEWVNEQFSWLSVWQFRKAMSLLRSLGIVKVVRYKARQWNQTNYYTLDGDRLIEYLKSQTSESIEISEMWSNTDQGEEYQSLEVRDTEISLNESKITTREVTAEQSVAAETETSLREEEIQKRVKSPEESSTTCNGQNQVKSEQVESNIGEDKISGRVDYIVNAECAVRQAPEFNSGEPDRKNWEKQIQELDDAGIPVNKTVVNLLKMYSAEQVRGAIALVRSRKRDQHIPNPSGYFVAALKQDWASKQIVESPESTGEIDTAAVFRHWYDLARELGYCSGQEIRDGEQWVCISGSWEKWADAVSRGYSLEYLKKIMKRNTRQ